MRDWPRGEGANPRSRARSDSNSRTREEVCSNCGGMEFMLQEVRGRKNEREKGSFAPPGLVRLWLLHPRLTPWAAFFRRFAAIFLGFAVRGRAQRFQGK